MIDWVIVTMNTSMRDLTVLQWAFVVVMVVAPTWALIMLDERRARRRRRQ